MIELKRIQESDLARIHDIGFTRKRPFWAKMNAPYFEEYEQLDFPMFLKKQSKVFLKDEEILGIYLNDTIIGVVTSYWESKPTRWLEVGILIYDFDALRKGYGKEALELWIDRCFEDYPEIMRVGLTTWSGNLGMIRLAEKLGLKEEARLRKVRFYQDVYYDSMKYGILRDEWYKR